MAEGFQQPLCTFLQVKAFRFYVEGLQGPRSLLVDDVLNRLSFRLRYLMAIWVHFGRVQFARPPEADHIEGQLMPRK